MSILNIIDGVGVTSMGLSWLYNRRRATVNIGWFIFIGVIAVVVVIAHGLQGFPEVAR